MSTKWIYRVVSIAAPKTVQDEDKVSTDLNNWGDQGWELVQIIGNYHYFKQEKQR
jgi:hypothetical protein